jgi:hypothetical protein
MDVTRHRTRREQFLVDQKRTFADIFGANSTSALAPKRTFAMQLLMSALAHKRASLDTNDYSLGKSRGGMQSVTQVRCLRERL